MGPWKVSMAMPPCLANTHREFMLKQSKRNTEVDSDRSKFKTRIFHRGDGKTKIAFIYVVP